MSKSCLISSVGSLRQQAMEIRRDIHKHAEVAWTEFRTGSVIVKNLIEIGGWEVSYGPHLFEKSLMLGMPSPEALDRHAERAINQGGDAAIIDKMRGGFTGVVATLKIGDGNGPVVAFRVDIDANDLNEAKDPEHRPYREGFLSVNDGAMHACGHDCHTTMGIIAARALYENRHVLPPGTVKIIFQTGEEGGRGGHPMAAAGVADDADYFMALHVAAETQIGFVAASASHMINTTKADAVFKGVPAHAGARPEAGSNALLAAANATLNLYAITRHSEGVTRVNVGVLQAGVGRNVIPPNALMRFETRGESRAINDFMMEKAQAVIEGSARMYGCEATISKAGECVSAPMNPEMVDIVTSAARDIPAVHTVEQAASMQGGGEDCTFFMLRVQERGGKATLAFIGTPSANVLHNSYFDVDEEVLVVGAQLIASVAHTALSRGRVRR